MMMAPRKAEQLVQTTAGVIDLAAMQRAEAENTRAYLELKRKYEQAVQLLQEVAQGLPRQATAHALLINHGILPPVTEVRPLPEEDSDTFDQGIRGPLAEESE